MKERSIITNLLPTLVLSVAMGVSLICGILSSGIFALAIYLFPILYFVFYFVTKANNLGFPMYFFIALAFLIGNTSSTMAGKLPMVILFQSMVVVIAVVICLIISLKNHKPLKPEGGVWNYIKKKYQIMLENDPQMTLRITMHCLILYIAGFTGFLLADYRGKWVLLSCGAVLIGDELKTLTRRGINFSIGVTIGCIIAFFIAFFEVPLSVRAWFYIPAFIGVFICMPRVSKHPQFYIGGSSMVAVIVMLGDSLVQDYMTYDIVAERFICGLIGLAIALICTHLVSAVNKQVYA